MTSLQVERMEKAFEWLQTEFQNTGAIGDFDTLIMQLSSVNSVLSWSYEQQAVSKRLLREATAKAYETFVLSMASVGKAYPPSIAKDYVSNKVAETSYNAELAEKLCSALVHIGDNLRTQLSALKEQLKLNNYTN